MAAVIGVQPSTVQTPSIVGTSNPLATAGAVLAAFVAVLEQLRNLEDFLVSDGDYEARSALVDVMHKLSLQRNSFEDTAVWLLCDVVPFSRIATFFTASGGQRWQEAEVQAEASRQLGSSVQTYCGTCTVILQGLNDIKDTADRASPEDAMADSEDEGFDPMAWKVALRDVWQQKNMTIVADLEKHNHSLRSVLLQRNQLRRDRIQAANTVQQTILDLIADSSPGATQKLVELCQRVQNTDEKALFNKLNAVKTSSNQGMSFQACLSDSRSCGAASTTPYETLRTLRLRWAINHIPDVVNFREQRCCWPECRLKFMFPSLNTFLSHMMSCQHMNSSQYACLQSLENAWYDNRSAWETLSNSAGPQGLEMKPNLQWPCEDASFSQRAFPPGLEVDRNRQIASSGNARVDMAQYKGVVLARKQMRWKEPKELEMLKQESQTLRRLSHCHIIQLFGSYNQYQDYTILLYPYCDYSLSSFMEVNCMETSVEEVLRNRELLRDRLYLQSFFPCLAQALMYIHTNTTRHADIKPDNILIKQSLAKVEDGRRYHVYIADFGSASMYSSVSRTCRFAQSTPKYCAPELAPLLANEDPTMVSDWGRAADVFSLGCVFAEMLTVLANKDLVKFDNFRSGRMSASDGAAAAAAAQSAPPKPPKPQPLGAVDESFCKHLPRVYEWLQTLRQVVDDKMDPGGYWYRRGQFLAFASWDETFLDTIGITASMLSEVQDDRPKVAEVVRRLDVDDCCSREIIPFFALSQS